MNIKPEDIRTAELPELRQMVKDLIAENKELKKKTGVETEKPEPAKIEKKIVEKEWYE